MITAEEHRNISGAMRLIQKQSFYLLWHEHLRHPFPRGCYDVVVNGEKLVLLDSDLGACVSWFKGYLDGDTMPENWILFLRETLTLLDKVLEETDDACVQHFTRWQEMVVLMLLILGEEGNLIN